MGHEPGKQLMRTKILFAAASAAVLMSGSATAQALPALVRAAAVGASTVAVDSLADLPLIVVRAKGAPSGALAVMLTGDGGWAGLDKELADSIASHGSTVVAVDTRAYLSRKRDPESASRDLERILRHYLPASGAEHVLLVGYSHGAEVLPFMATRLPHDLLNKVRVVALLGPARNANFKFHLIDLVSNRSRKDDLMTVPEVEKLRGRRILCFYGADEKESACRAFDPSIVTLYEMPGGHHFGKKYGVIATRILEAQKDVREQGVGSGNSSQ
jgi:type IV secretory pathway VirJ component